MGDTYKKSKGNAGLDGVQFQLNLLTVFLLNALHCLKNWKISTENQEAGKYDDLVLELPDKSILLQAKFKQNKKINRDQLFSCNSKSADFSLPKYFFSYLEVKSASIQKTVIICTNTDIDERGLEDFLICHRVGTDSLLYCEDANSVFFTFNDNILADLKASAEIYFDKNLQSKGIDKAVITDKNIKDFLENLQFFSNFPSGDKLDKVIGQLLSRLNHSSLYFKVSSQDIYKKIESWFKQPKGEYLTEARAKAIFSEIKSDKFCEQLKNYEVSFNHNSLNFMNSKRIFLITSEVEYLLQILKIYDALQKNERKQLYVNPDEAIEVQKQVIEAFCLPRYEHLIIIATNKITEETTINEISTTLKDVLEKYNYKKLILVTGREDKLVQQIGIYDILHVDGSVSFEDLSNECRMRLVKENNIIFQGDQISLEELLAPQTSGDWTKAVNSEILEKLIRKNKIKVGLLPADLDEDNFQYYVHRTFQREVCKTEVEQDTKELMENMFPGAMTTLNVKLKKKEEMFAEDSIYDLKEDVILIADSAGMGKSTVLTNLAKTIKDNCPHLWVIRIELTEYTDILRNLLKNDGESLSVIKLLNSKRATKLTNHLEKFVFSMTKKVVLMLDGIDEISPDYTELVLGLLTECQQATNFKKLFVTTRPHMIDELEEILKVKPFLLQPFTEQNQMDFLTSYWAHNLNVCRENKEKCEQYARELIKRMSSWTKVYDYNDFSAIPLQLRILAEIFQESIKWNKSSNWEGCKEYLKATRVAPKLPERMEIKELYDMFVEKKRDIYVNKGNPSGNTAANKALTDQFDDSLNHHKKLALEIILHKQDCLLFSSYRQSCKNINETILKMGIVQKSNHELNFIHRTFIEYFVAESLVSELQLQLHSPNVKFQEFFIHKILQSSEYRIIRIFLDSFLMKIFYCIPPSIFDNYRSYACSGFHTKNEHFLIHVLANDGCVAILQLILKCINFEIIRDKEINIIDLRNRFFDNKRETNDSGNVLKTLQFFVGEGGINIKDEFGSTPLSKAAKNGHFYMVKFLDKLGSSIDSIDNEGYTALHFAAFSGRMDIVEFLVQRGTNVNIKNKCGHTPLFLALLSNRSDVIKYLVQSGSNINIKDNDGWTALHFAARNGDLSIISLLLKLGVDIYVGDNEGYTAVHVAVSSGNLTIVQFFHGQLNIDFTVRDNSGHTTLHFAAEYGRLKIVKYLTQLGLDVNAGDKDGCTALHRAAANGQLATVKLLGQLGGDFTATDNTGQTVLHFAAGNGHLNIVKFLLQQGVDVNIGNSDGSTALHWAVLRGHLDTVKFLLDAGADSRIEDDTCRTALYFALMNGSLTVIEYLVKFSDINIKDSMGRTALHLASGMGKLEVVKFLLGLGVDFNVGENNGRTELHLAAENGHLDTVKFFLELGVDVNSRDSDGFTALHLSAAHGQLASVKLLLELGGDINARDNSGHTALHFAVRNCQSDIVMFLLNLGIDVNAGNTDGYTAVHVASEQGHLATVKLLQQHGGDFTVKDYSGHTALHLAAANGHLAIVKFFFELGVDINVRESVGYTALHLAALTGQLAIIKFFLEQGVDVNAGTAEGCTALHLAATNGHLELFKFLIEFGVDVNVGDIDGSMALHFAASGGHLPVIEYIFALGGDINVKDINGCTALHFASAAGHLDAIKFLLDLGADFSIKNNDGNTARQLALNLGHSEIANLKMGKTAAKINK